MGLLVLISPLLWTYHMGFHWIRLRRWQWIYNVGPIASINMEISWLVVFILRIPIWLDHMPYFKFIFSIANIWLLFFVSTSLLLRVQVYYYLAWVGLEQMHVGFPRSNMELSLSSYLQRLIGRYCDTWVGWCVFVMSAMNVFFISLNM